MSDFYQVISTIDNKEKAEQLCRKAVEKRLAACAQISNELTSIYWWKNAIETAKEYYCVFKTTKKIYPQLEKFITENHPYDTPEIIALPITAISKKYSEWLNSEINSL